MPYLEMMIERSISPNVLTKVGRGKAILLIGPRQVGKTTLIRHLLDGQDLLFLNCDDPSIRQLLESPNTEDLKQLIGKNEIVFIDEAQRIPNIGLTLKLITDQMKNVQLWISGSSSFQLSNELNEPLTGRKWEYELLPISWEEFEKHLGFLKAQQQLKNRMRFGFYPDVINNPGEEVEILKTLVNDYLYKDVLSLSNIRKPKVLENLVRLLAFQVGSQVNYNELSKEVGVDRNTILRYIDLLEKGYVLFSLDAFSRNVRNEIKKSKKIYFYDNGIRNAVINNFRPLDLRADIGALWENFLVAERIKQHKYNLPLVEPYFWRTTKQQEIDFVEDEGGEIRAYEFTWNPKNKKKISKTFTRAYEAETAVIHRENFREFVLPRKE